MKNRDKYKDELIETIKMEGAICGFVRNHGVAHMLAKDIESYCKMDCIACGTTLQIWLDEEYIEPPKPEVDWSNVPIDTLVRVRDREDQEWRLRYFKGIDDSSSERFMTWECGATSVTAEDGYTNWKYCELVEDEDNGK